jgi:UDP-2-acetamido-3-amino-2,3-dideoxy-glucuronate N-acetyltransferase
MSNKFHFRHYCEPDGTLIPVEFEAELPFIPRRMFWISNIPSGVDRGGHAHKECHQYVFMVDGECWAESVSDGWVGLEKLEKGAGVHVPPLTWFRLTEISEDAIIGVFASHPYDPNDYINTKEELEQCRASRL